MKSYKVELGAMVEVPIYENHKRGKNWCAIITKDPKSPGGLYREFLERAHLPYYYFVEGVKVGDVLEFGADYYTQSRNKSPNRLYAVVTAITSTEIQLEEFTNVKEAFEYAQKLQEREIEDVEIPYNEELGKYSDNELIRELERRGYKVVNKDE
jgi:hypothetical protein